MTEDQMIKNLWRTVFLAIGITTAIWVLWSIIDALFAPQDGFHGRDDYNYSQFYQTAVAGWQAYEGNEILAEITYYTNRSRETDHTPDITASNQRVREGIVANNCYDFGTKIEIDGRQYEIQDKMNRRYSCEHFDIFTFDLEKAINFGRQNIIIKIYGNKKL